MQCLIGHNDVQPYDAIPCLSFYTKVRKFATKLCVKFYTVAAVVSSSWDKLTPVTEERNQVGLQFFILLGVL